MFYFDSAYIAKCYVREPGSDEVLDLAEASAGRTSLVLAVVEVNAVFQRHFREKKLTHDQLLEICLRFDKDQKDGLWHWLPMDTASIQQAGTKFRHLPPKTFLRSADCLHLAAASEAGFAEIYSNDPHLLAAAPYFGLRGVNVIPDAG
jgi:predicted nucleic acid-binding protein